MHIPQFINITLAAGQGGGVTSNKRVYTPTTAKPTLRVESIIFMAPSGNAADIKIGHSIWTAPTESTANPNGSFANPADPLTEDTSVINLAKSTSFTFIAVPNQQEIRGRWGLEEFWVQGSAADKVKVIYVIGIDK